MNGLTNKRFLLDSCTCINFLIEAFSLKAYRMWGNKSPTPPVLRPKGRGIKPHGKGAVAFHVSAWIETIIEYPLCPWAICLSA
jgi:hypothetical protein